MQAVWRWETSHFPQGPLGQGCQLSSPERLLCRPPLPHRNHCRAWDGARCLSSCPAPKEAAWEVGEGLWTLRKLVLNGQDRFLEEAAFQSNCLDLQKG